MKKFLSLFMFLVCLITCLTSCSPKTEPKVTADNSASATILDNSSNPSASAPSTAITTALPEQTYIVSISSPDASIPAGATPTPTATPVPTPTPTIRPAQLDSIVPHALLTTGYTTPLDPEKVNFPENYNMPYYIEVDLTNQCVNIFRKNTETGKYDILLNRFICSAGTSKQPSRTGNFFIKTDEQQKAATGQVVKYTRYYFKKYYSYAYYITRYSNEYMFHSFTFGVSGGKIVPKSSAYYNMGNAGSAGCLRMLMGHAKWIYENIDGGTYCVVNKSRARDNTLRSTLKKYVPPLGWDMTPEWDGNRSNYTGLVRADFIENPEKADHIPVTPSPSPTPTPEVTPTVAVTPTYTPPVTPTATAGVTPTASSEVTPEVTPEATPEVTAPPTDEPTEPPAEPTEPPIEPTEPPIEPTEPPVEPTEPAEPLITTG